MKTLTLDAFNAKMTKLLRRPELVPYLSQDVLDNGLQTRGNTTVKTVGFAVSANMATFEQAKKQKCDALVVHHGVILPATHFDAITYNRYAYLIKNNLSLWSAHFLLDAHPTLGNNVQILKTIGARPTKPYMFDRAPWGWVGEFTKPQPFTAVLKKLRPYMSPRTVVYDYGSKTVKRVVVVSGKGSPWTQDASQLVDDGVDLYITGETHEWIRDIFREINVNFIAGGHYHTEMFGVKAVQKEVAKWGVRTEWIDTKNDI
jgi:dinuclear metal center YbgI/SA1388 family protein